MFEFWLTMGSMVVDATVLPEIVAANPVFTPMTLTVIEDGVQREVKGAGRLQEGPTTVLRGKLQTILNGRFPDIRLTPSLYLAGKMSQFALVDQNVANVHLPALQAAYTQAASQAGLGRPSAHLVALMGVCLFDDGLAAELVAAGGSSVAQKFFVNTSGTPEGATLLAFLQSAALIAARTAFMGSPMWDHGCEQRFTFYEPFETILN